MSFESHGEGEVVPVSEGGRESTQLDAPVHLDQRRSPAHAEEANLLHRAPSELPDGKRPQLLRAQTGHLGKAPQIPGAFRMSVDLAPETRKPSPRSLPSSSPASPHIRASSIGRSSVRSPMPLARFSRDIPKGSNRLSQNLAVMKRRCREHRPRLHTFLSAILLEHTKQGNGCNACSRHIRR